MYGCIINAVASFELERNLNILRNLVVNAEIEVVNVSTPIARRGYNAVCPTGVRIELFLIVEEICGKLFYDLVFLAKHQKSCGGGVHLSVT